MRVLFTRFLLLGVVAVTAVHVNTVKAQTAPAAQATTVTIRGRVIDKKDKQSLIGATVVEIDKDKRTVSGVATDLNGNFALKLKNPKNKISFSLIV